MVMVNSLWSCMQSSKDMKGLPRNFVLFLQSSSPDVRREGGGGKTNISLLESSEEWAQKHQQGKTEHKKMVKEEKKGLRHLIKKETFGWSILVTWLRFFVQTLFNMGVYEREK